MRVLCISNHSTIKGGADTVFHNEASLLASSGHDVLKFSSSEVLTGHVSHNGTGPDNFYTGFVEYKKGSLLAKARNIVRFFYRYDVFRDLGSCIDEFKPDVAHLHIIYGQLSNSVLKVLKSRNIPVVMTVHDYRLLCPVSNMLDSNAAICSKCAGKSAISAVLKNCKADIIASTLSASESMFRDAFSSYHDYVDHFIFVSAFCYRLHLQYFPEIEGKSSVVNNFAAFSHLTSNLNRCSVPRKYIYFGRLAKEKGLDTLCQSFVGYNRELIIVGSGPEESSLRAKYAGNANIQFCGFLSFHEISKILMTCSFSILPSEWYENYPMSIIESYVHGVPVLGANIGGIPEMIDDGITGYLFDSNSSESLIATLDYADGLPSDIIIKMGVLGRKFFQSHNSPEHHHKKLVTIYKKLEKGKIL